MLSFAVLGSSESILRMIEVDLPARYSRTPTQMLGFAMMELAHMSARTAKARTDVRPIVDALWDQIIERGQQDAPSMLRYRLEALNYVHDAKASFGLYDYAKVELRKRKIAYGDAYINPLHFSHLCFTNRLSAALAVLDDHQNCDHIANRIAYVEFIKHALGNDMDVASRRKLLWKIMQIKPDDVRIRGGSWGRILAFFLECGQPIERACEEVAKKRGIGQSTSFFAPLIRNLIRAKSDSSEQQLEAAVYLLERHFPRDASATTTAFRTFATWRPVATFVSRSNVLSGPHRHELLERLVACYPRNFPHENIDLLYLAIVHASLSRPTEEGVPEALYWWSKISPGNASAHHYKMLISRLVYHGYPQVAEEIVATLRPGPKTQQVITYAQSLGITTGLAHGDIDLHLEQPESLEDREELLEDEGEAEEVLSDEADTVLTQS